MTDDSLIEAGDQPVVRLVRWTGPWADDDPDANFKADVATYTFADPLHTVANLAENLDVPLGAVVRYVLARWAAAGSEGLLALGPTVVQRLSDTIEAAEDAGTDEARLDAYASLRDQLRWLRIPLDDPDRVFGPDGGNTSD